MTKTEEWMRENPPFSAPYPKTDFNKCEYCEELTLNGKEYPYNCILCDECQEKYDNKTGYCSLDCCILGHCDSSC